MTEFAKARDWLGELGALVVADQLEAFQALVKEALEARPDLEDKVFAMTAEYMASPKQEKPADFFYRATLPKVEPKQEVLLPAKFPRRDLSGLEAREKAERERLLEFYNQKPEAEANALVHVPAAEVLSPPPPPKLPPGPKELVELNKKHAVISNLGGKCVIMEYVPSKVTEGQTEISYQTFEAFKQRYSNRYVVVPYYKEATKAVGLGEFWIAHPGRRQYESLNLVPNAPQVLPGNVFNLWSGFGVEQKQGEWSLLRRHVEEVLANGSKAFADYILRWTAWTVQHPGEPTGAALVVRGGKGTGKGTWGQVLIMIFGQHALQIFDPNHLVGKHNQHLQDKLFLFADEAFWAGDKTAERTLKGLVTEKKMMIEPKNINAFPWPNRLSIFMAANANWVVPASHDERRYAVGSVSERWKQNKAYFRPLWAEIENGGVAALLWDLLRMDLGDWHPMENIPQTAELLQQKMLSLTGLQQWWVNMLDLGELPSPDRKNPRRVSSGVLLEAAKKYSQRNTYIEATELGNFLGDMGCTHKSNGKNWGWIFPPLPEAREAWTLRAGAWKWLEPDLQDWGEKPGGEVCGV
jgi:Family of unknown function (DUF5906)